MITGFNTEVKYGNRTYHVQTEDKGERNPIIETLIYVGGEIIDIKRTSYAEILRTTGNKEEIRKLMELQHRKTIALIKSGKYAKEKGQEAIKESDEGKQKEALEKEITSRSLDQVILDYLAEHAKDEKLALEIKGDENLLEGYPVSLSIKSYNQSNKMPISKAKIVIKIISTIRKPITVFEGFTNEQGFLNINFVVPEFPHGNAAIIIQAFSDIGNEEIKQLIKKSSKKL